MPECHVCGLESDDIEDFLRCQDCGELTCSTCGDGDMCFMCVGDEMFLTDMFE